MESISDDTAQLRGQLIPSFTLFPELPVELRRTIWKLSIRPRLVRVTASHSQDLGNEGTICFVIHQTPLILHVNREAREKG